MAPPAKSTATQNDAETHDTPVIVSESTGSGAVQTVPSKVSTLPRSSPATQKLRLVQDSAWSSRSSICTAGVQEDPSKTITTPVAELNGSPNATQNVGDEHDTPL